MTDLDNSFVRRIYCRTCRTRLPKGTLISKALHSCDLCGGEMVYQGEPIPGLDVPPLPIDIAQKMASLIKKHL